MAQGSVINFPYWPEKLSKETNLQNLLLNAEIETWIFLMLPAKGIKIHHYKICEYELLTTHLRMGVLLHKFIWRLTNEVCWVNLNLSGSAWTKQQALSCLDLETISWHSSKWRVLEDQHIINHFWNYQSKKYYIKPHLYQKSFTYSF